MKGLIAWSPIGYEGPEQSLSAIWINPNHQMPLDRDLHRMMVGHRINLLLAQLDEPEEAVAEMVAIFYNEGCWPDTKSVPVEDAGAWLIANNGNVSGHFTTLGISQSLPVSRVFEMPSVREILENEMADPWETLIGWVDRLVGSSYAAGPSAEQEMIQLAHMNRCGHLSQR